MHFTNREGNKPGRAFKSYFRVDHKQITHNQMTLIAWSPLTPFTQNAPCQSCGRAAFWLSEAAVHNSRAKVLRLKRRRLRRRNVRNTQILKTRTRKNNPLTPWRPGPLPIWRWWCFPNLLFRIMHSSTPKSQSLAMLELTLLGQVSPNSCHLLMDPLAMHQKTKWPGSEMYPSLNLL